MKTDKKGVVKKSNTELLLLSGSVITTLDEETGEVIEYMLSSDTSVVLEHEARLFPAR